jgi:hypothetical protein
LTRQHRSVALVLRVFGCVDLLALVAVFLPGGVLRGASVWLGLAALPAEPLAGYLARSASLMYALHGAAILFVSFDVPRYWELIRFLALLAVVHGALMLWIDVVEGMPAWWQVVEGPCFALTGVVVLLVMQRGARCSTPGTSVPPAVR